MTPPCRQLPAVCWNFKDTQARPFISFYRNDWTLPSGCRD
jgi:hypothetical protein